MIERGERGPRHVVVCAAFHRQRSLSGRGKQGQVVGDGLRLAQPFQAGGCQHDRVEITLLHPCQTRTEIAPHIHVHQVRTKRPQLGHATRRAGSDPSPRRQRRQRQPIARAQHVAMIRAWGDGGDDEARHRCDGQILQRVNSKIDLSGEQARAQLGREDPQCSERRQRPTLDVAASLDAHQIHRVTQPAQCVGHGLRLGDGQRRPSGAESHANSCLTAATMGEMPLPSNHPPNTSIPGNSAKCSPILER